MKNRCICFLLLAIGLIMASFTGCRNEILLPESSVNEDVCISCASNLSSDYYVCKDLDVSINEIKEDPTVFCGSFSDENIWVLLQADDSYYLNQYDYNGNKKRSTLLQLPNYLPYDNYMFTENNNIFIVSSSFRSFDIICVDSAEFSYKQIVHDTSQGKVSFADIVGKKNDTVYVLLSDDNAEKVIIRGYNIHDGKCTMEVFTDYLTEGVILSDEYLYAVISQTSEDSYDTIKISAEGREVETVSVQMPEKWRKPVYQNETQYLENEKGLWYLDSSLNTWMNILNYSQTDMDQTSGASYETYVVSPNKERILFHGHDTSKVSMLFPGNNPNEGKKAIVVAGIGIPDDIVWAIQEYNRTDGQCHIEIQHLEEIINKDDYLSAEGWIDIQAYNNAVTDYLWKKIDSGEGPDIVIRSFSDASLLGTKYFEYGGLYTDLAPYWNNMDIKWREQYISNVMESMMIDNQFYAIPLSFQVCSSSADNSCGMSADGTYFSWRKYMGESSQGEALYYMTNQAFLRESLSYDLDSFVNYDEERTKFDSAEFRALLELSSEYCLSQQEWNDLKERPTVLKLDTYNASDVRRVLSNQTNDNSYKFGRITADGAQDVIRPETMVSITSKCKEMECAWNFIQYLLSSEVQEYQLRKEHPVLGHFPVRWDSVDFLLEFYEYPELHEDFWREEYNSEGDYDENWTVESVQSISSEDVSCFKHWISSIESVYYPDIEIIDLVVEEALAYYSGQRSEDDVINTISNRVQTVLDERG